MTHLGLARFPDARRLALMETFGREILRRRGLVGLDRKGLAARMHISESALSKIEEGISAPSSWALYLAAEALGCGMDDLAKGRMP